MQMIMPGWIFLPKDFGILLVYVDVRVFNPLAKSLVFTIKIRMRRKEHT